MLGLPNLSASELAEGARALRRAGVLRPRLPRPALLGLALELPLLHTNLGTAVALQAATQPDGVAIIDRSGMLTWSEMERRVNRLANVVLAHGQSGGCLAFLLRNGREALECYAAGGRSGLAPVPLNTWATGSEIARILHMQRPAVLVADEEFRETVETAVRDLDDPPVVLLVGPGGSYETALAGAASSAPFNRGTGKIVIHTSGTTGAPKGAERDASSSGIGAAVGFITRIPIKRSDRVMICSPLFHAFALGVSAATLAIGATTVLPRSFDPSRFATLINEHGINAATMVPIQLRRCVDESDAAAKTDPLRIIVTSGSALPLALRDQAQERFGPVVHDIYGSTEAGLVSISTPEDFARKRGTVGLAMPGTRVEVIDDDGAPLPTGEIGRLRVATGTEFSGYTGSDGHSGAWDIGDLGYVDDEGYIFVTGRKDEMIISGGENIYPSEVEEHLNAHPDISEAAVIGVDDAEFGQVLRAYVVGDVQPEAVTAWLRTRLTRYKVPKRVVVLDELPRNATGKVLKRQLLKAEHPARG